MDSKCDLLPTDKTLNVGDVLAIHCVGTQWSVFLGGTPSTIKQKIFHLKNIMIDDIVNFPRIQSTDMLISTTLNINSISLIIPKGILWRLANSAKTEWLKLS